jgi:ABC-type multidrug transport system fused ATPase/permease subunit
LQVLRILLKINTSHARWILLPFFILGMAIALFDVVGVGLVFPLIALLTDATPAVGNRLFSFLGEWFGSHALRPVALIFLIVAAFLVKNTLQAFYIAAQARLLASTQEDLANRLVRGYLRAPYSTHLERHSAELIRNVANLVRGAYGEALNAMLGLGADLLAAAALIALLLVVAPAPSLVAGLMMTALLYLQQRGFQRNFERLGAESAALCHEELLSLQQSLGALKEAQVLRREKFFEAELADIQRRLFVNARKFEFVRKLPPVVSEVAMMTVILVAVAIILMRDERGFLFAQLGVLAAATFRLMPLTNRIIMAMNMMHHARPGLHLLWRELVGPVPPMRERRTGERAAFSDRIELRNISYTFAGGTGPVLSDISLTIRRGEFIGLIGASGAGKSTLADIILNVLTPNKGEVAVDGRVMGAKGEDIHLSVGYVPQRIAIFDDSLRRNVAFAVTNASIDDARVERALAQAQLLDFARALPQGLDTALGENGQRLSGGQRQRIGIARALYHSPDLLVLDEATSALDLQTEQDFNAAIQALHGQLTLIVIAHRLSTVKICDRLIFLHQGHLVDQGAFAELLGRNNAFRRLVELDGLERPDR